MTWPALFFGVTFYFWFLLILPSLASPLPLFYHGPGGFLLLCLFPVLAASRLNLFLARFRRTAGGVIALNGSILLLVLVATLPVSGRLLLIPPADAGVEHWAAWLAPSGWQILSWLTGAGFAVTGDEQGGTPPGEREKQSNLSASRFSTALLVAAPPIILLDTGHYPALFLGGAVACWFITMVVTLALERSRGDGENRYSLVLVHGFVPLLAGAVFTVFAFSAGFLAVLEMFRFGLTRLLAVILHLLSLIGSAAPAKPAQPLDLQAIHFQERAVAATSALHPLVLTFMLLLFLGLAMLILVYLAALSMRTLEKNPGRIPAEPTSPLKTLTQTWLFICRLVLLLPWIIRLAFLQAWKAGILVLRWLSRAWRVARPPASASEAVNRSYRSFLKWGRRRTGLAIAPAQTPGEYLRQIETSAALNLSRLEPIRELTALFVEARYSGRQADNRQAARCRELLGLIREKPGV